MIGFARIRASQDRGAIAARIGMALATFLLVCCMAWFPQAEAHAWFNDVTDSYPASQEIPIKGDVITGADIPEGTYPITATASSYMCKFTNVTLTSVGGELWATFTLSKAYNALYFGTAEEAAAATNEDGTDYSAYYVTEPLEGYVARQFSLPIPALNYEITLATFSGGSKGIKEGMWYTRTVVFNASDEVMRAIESGSSDPSPAVDPGQSDDPDDSGEDPSGTNDGGTQDSAGDPTTDTDSGDDSSDDGSDDSDDDDDSSSKSKASSTAKNDGSANGGTRSNDSNGGGNNPPAAKEPESKEDEADKKEPARPKPEGNYKIGQEISFVGLDEIPLAELPAQTITIDQQKAERDESTAVAIVVGIVLVNLVLVGAFLAMVRRSRPRRFPRV